MWDILVYSYKNTGRSIAMYPLQDQDPPDAFSTDHLQSS